MVLHWQCSGESGCNNGCWPNWALVLGINEPLEILSKKPLSWTLYVRGHFSCAVPVLHWPCIFPYTVFPILKPPKGKGTSEIRLLPGKDLVLVPREESSAMGSCQHRTTQHCSHPALGTGQSGIAGVSPCTRPVMGTDVGTHCPGVSDMEICCGPGYGDQVSLTYWCCKARSIAKEQFNGSSVQNRTVLISGIYVHQDCFWWV